MYEIESETITPQTESKASALSTECTPSESRSKPMLTLNDTTLEEIKANARLKGSRYALRLDNPDVTPEARTSPVGRTVGDLSLLPNGEVFEMVSDAAIDRQLAEELAQPKNRRPIPPDQYSLFIVRVIEPAPDTVEVFFFVYARRRHLKVTFDHRDPKDAARFAELRNAAGLSADEPNANLQWQSAIGTVKCIAGRTRNIVAAYKPDAADRPADPELSEQVQGLLVRCQGNPDYEPTPEDAAILEKLFAVLDTEN